MMALFHGLLVMALVLGGVSAETLVKTPPVSRIKMPIGFALTDMAEGANSKIFTVGISGGRGELIEINTKKETRDLLKRFNRQFATILYIPSENWFLASDAVKPGLLVMNREKGLTKLARCEMPGGVVPTRMILADEVVWFGGVDKRNIYSIKVKNLLDCKIKSKKLSNIPKGSGDSLTYVQDIAEFKGLLFLAVANANFETPEGNGAIYLYDPEKDRGRFVVRNQFNFNLRLISGLVRSERTLYAAAKKSPAPNEPADNRITAWKIKNSNYGEIRVSYLGRFQNSFGGTDYDALIYSKDRVCVSSVLVGRDNVVCYDGTIFG
uniref:Uncharacterized protein n=2 Tax=Rhodosorus marinus TaxID=101924 RepID=A0A7S3A0B7_9RHOD|mmetsp:Transcript_38065/g.151129  ORF Transcript_38065/g.151129 Transcript_38065/m.151129 type:complete len:323 (+) Transcript_38065:122-1090(+)